VTSPADRKGAAATKVPRRDAEGRVASLPELFGVALLFAVVNGIGLVLVDAILALIHVSPFGRSSGWLILILPALLFFDDFRAWQAYGLRWLAAPVAAVVALALGLVGAGLAGGLAPLASGTIGGVVTTLAYVPVWFLGVRMLTGHRTEIR
jgi:hypothetical protein